jgi:predicted PurR-regulated permease PerM
MNIQKSAFLLLLLLVTLAFGWILLPFFGAVFWAVMLAIMFAPLNHRILIHVRNRQSLAAIITVLLCLVMVIVPVTLLIISLTQEAVIFYQKIRTGELDLGAHFLQLLTGLPPWLVNLLSRFDITDLATLREKITVGAMQGSQIIASHALQISQNIFNFLVSLVIMLYLLFFFLRDGKAVVEKINRTMPLHSDHKRILFDKFSAVIRATIKGNLIVAAAQGALGGIMFWILGIQGALLWGVLMAVLSLLPAGSGFVWVPVAIYFLLTGSALKGLLLLGFGMFVIGLIDNFLRPILVGKDTQMPDYIVLISTLGGLALFGLNGFIIGPTIAAMFIAVWELFDADR